MFALALSSMFSHSLFFLPLPFDVAGYTIISIRLLSILVALFPALCMHFYQLIIPSFRFRRPYFMHASNFVRTLRSWQCVPVLLIARLATQRKRCKRICNECGHTTYQISLLHKTTHNWRIERSHCRTSRLVSCFLSF